MAPNQAEQFAAFQAWQAQQAANPPIPADLNVPPTIAEVIHGIINVIGLATENLANSYHLAVDDWYSTSGAGSPDEPEPVDDEPVLVPS